MSTLHTNVGSVPVTVTVDDNPTRVGETTASDAKVAIIHRELSQAEVKHERRVINGWESV
jgi:hypothetical protein